MRLRNRLLRIVDRPHLPRRTIRLRLTALYGLLFTLSGAALLVITNVLVRSATGSGTCREVARDIVTCTIPGRQVIQGHHTVSQTVVNFGGVSGYQGIAIGRGSVRELSLLANSGTVADLHNLLVYSWFASAIMAGVSVVLGWFVAGRVLRPLRTITTTARNISATNLHERLALAGPNDELKELGDTFDDLLARLEHFIQAQRQFVANASHELRTPLAFQRTLVQLALADPDADTESLRAADERVLASGVQQERLIEALLTLTRGQAGLARRERFDLAPVVEQVLLARESEARRRSIDVRAELSSTETRGDLRLVERLVANVVDNALSYNSTPGRVDVTTKVHHGRAVLSVTNTGPVVDPDAVERLTQPFQRLASERAARGEGSGLGLSIVRAITEAHGGALTIRPRPGGGLNVEVALPGTDDDEVPGERDESSTLSPHEGPEAEFANNA